MDEAETKKQEEEIENLCIFIFAALTVIIILQYAILTSA